MNAIVIEDEQIASDRICEMIHEEGEINILAQLDTVKEAVSFISETKDEIDILFCDIQLADGLSFNIFNKVEVKSPVIFTTAYDEYSLQAFEVNSLDYLLKPIKKEDLRRALSKYDNLYDRSVFKLKPEFVSDFLNRNNYKERFLVKLGTKFFHKQIADITYFSTENKLVYLHDTQSGRRYLTDYSLEELERDHLNPRQFFRISRQFIVNMNFIEVLKPYSGQRLSIQLAQGQADELVVSRDKVSAFKDWFDQ